MIRGEPIVRSNLDELDHSDEKRRKMARGLLWSVLVSWVEFEVVAITARRNFFPGVHLPLGHRTNIVSAACDLHFVPVLARTSLCSAMMSGTLSLKAFNEYLRYCGNVGELSNGEVQALTHLEDEIDETRNRLAAITR